MKNIKVMHIGNIQKERQELRMGKYTLSDVVCFIVGRMERVYAYHHHQLKNNFTI